MIHGPRVKAVCLGRKLRHEVNSTAQQTRCCCHTELPRNQRENNTCAFRASWPEHI